MRSPSLEAAMHPILYVNNFRGFDDTFIQFSDVNFLVGQNSTGKTSILSLINLLGSVQFYLRQEFNDENVQFGNFKDIVSIKSQNKKFFHVGVIEVSDDETKNSQRGSDAWLMAFGQQDGLPIISEFLEIAGDEQIKLSFGPKEIKYHLSKFNTKGDKQKRIMSLFRKQVRSTGSDESDFSSIQKPRGFSPKRFFAQKSLIYEQIGYKNLADIARDGISAPIFAYDFAWIAPVRSKPKRTYDSYQLDFSPEGDHTPYLIRQLLSGKTSKERFSRLIERYGKSSGLFDALAVKNYTDEDASPFELDAIIDGSPLKISNIGYGVSQVLPILVESIARRKNFWIAIQQPEVHLHPKAQATIGDLIFDLARYEKKNFLVETHSDFLIDRFRVNYRSRSNTQNPSSQVLFFERTKKGNRVTSISITNTGEYSEKQPLSFRQFFLHEEMRILGLK